MAIPTRHQNNMKTLYQQVKQAFDALEFSNISQLNELNTRLDRLDQSEPADLRARAFQRKVAHEFDKRTITPANSPCF